MLLEFLVCFRGCARAAWGAVVANGHSGHEFDPSVAVLTPPLVQCDPSIYDWRTDLDTLEKKQFFEYNEIVAGTRM